MTNEIIGIVGAIVLTFLLFVLRHFILTLGRSKKRRSVAPMARRENRELNKRDVEDDAWLLWVPDLATEFRADRGQTREARG
jgi:hypothetical protein